ncbi:MAG: sulfatase-like hydrolase/transferase [Chitinivibrionales bacterium]|nr:sulfatase-like hydrolase/transferase [Chitinivibrionales bacterium]
MKQPNVVLIVADDVTYHDLPLYGGQNVKTPAIDALGSQGVVFNNAFLSMSMCAPCRAELYTGLYPVRNGCCWNHSPSRTGTQSIVHHMHALGYRVGLAGKKHADPESTFPFEDVPGLTDNCVAKETHFDPAGIKAFMEQESPFCLVVGLVEAHGPWTMGDPSHFERSELKLPPFMADTPETRENFARYLAEVEVLDQRVGATLDTLESSGKAGDTLVIFTSEQGAQFPGGKWTNWNTGVHTGFMVRWPGYIEPGQRSDAIIQYADVVPTLIELAGGNPQEANLDGTSFLTVLRGESTHVRRYGYFMHNNIPEGPPYPIRAISDGRHHYIRNLRHEAMYIEKHMMADWNKYWHEWVVKSTFNQHTEDCVRRYMVRPPEQLYDLQSDPFEMNNVANDPQYAQVQRELSEELDRWMTTQGDPGLSIDTKEQWKAARNGEHFVPVG